VHAVDAPSDLQPPVLAQEFRASLRDDQADEVDRALLVPRQRLLPPQRRSAGAGLGAVDARVADDKSLTGDPANISPIRACLRSKKRLTFSPFPYGPY
jgi:hypothetical protein